MLEIRIIQESNSTWSSPMVLVKKKDRSTWFYIPYRRLNQPTTYRLPQMEDTRNTLGADGTSVAPIGPADTGRSRCNMDDILVFGPKLSFLGHIVSAEWIGGDMPIEVLTGG